MTEVVINGTDGESSYVIEFSGPIQDTRNLEINDAVDPQMFNRGSGSVTAGGYDAYTGPLPATVTNADTFGFITDVPDIIVESEGQSIRLTAGESVTIDEQGGIGDPINIISNVIITGSTETRTVATVENMRDRDMVANIFFTVEDQQGNRLAEDTRTILTLEPGNPQELEFISSFDSRGKYRHCVEVDSWQFKGGD